MPLSENDAFREAIINVFANRKWVSGSNQLSLNKLKLPLIEKNLNLGTNNLLHYVTDEKPDE